MSCSTVDVGALDLLHLHLVALSLVHHVEDAWDLVQETILCALQDPLPQPASPSLCGLVRTVAKKRTPHRPHQVADDLDQLPSPHNDPAELAELAEFERLLERSIDRLPVPLKTVVDLRYARGWGTARIARNLRCSSRAIRYRLQRAHNEASRLAASRGGVSGSIKERRSPRRKRKSVEQKVRDLEARIERLRNAAHKADCFLPKKVAAEIDRLRLTIGEYAWVLGVTQVTAEGWLTGKHRPRGKNLDRWIATLGITREEAKSRL